MTTQNTNCENGEAILVKTENGIATFKCSECGESYEQLADDASPAEVLSEVIDQTRYELVQEIRRQGSRAQEAIRDYEEIAAAARRALSEGESPMGQSRLIENPVQILRDMEGLIRTAKLIGVPEACIVAARRGEFVALHDYITPR